MNNSNLDTYYIFQKLITEFSTANLTKNDYYIILAIIDSICDKSGNMSIENLAATANVSVGSISNFIRKIGFNNYTDYRIKMQSIKETLPLIRRQSAASNGLDDTTRIYNNLKSTEDSLNYDLLEKIIEELKNCKSCMFYGAPDNITQLSSLYKDALSNGIPCYYFLDTKTQLQLIDTLGENSIIIIPTTNSDLLTFASDYLTPFINRGGKIIAIVQKGQLPVEDYPYITYTYGIANDGNIGEHSLHYLSAILGKMLYS